MKHETNPEIERIQNELASLYHSHTSCPDYETEQRIVALGYQLDSLSPPSDKIEKFRDAFNKLREGTNLPLIETKAEAEKIYNALEKTKTKAKDLPILMLKASAKEVEVNIDAFRCIIKLMPSINIVNADGNTSLHLAVLSDNRTFAEILLAANASTSLKNNKGDTPLHLAANKQNPVFVDMLTNAKADPYATNLEGFTPAGIALDLGRKSCFAALSKYEFYETHCTMSTEAGTFGK